MPGPGAGNKKGHRPQFLQCVALVSSGFFIYSLLRLSPLSVLNSDDENICSIDKHTKDARLHFQLWVGLVIDTNRHSCP
jgi:hypothetical protein